ncbi:MAG: DUF192 domain-containing protein [Thermoplasmatota archaeon]
MQKQQITTKTAIVTFFPLNNTSISFTCEVAISPTQLQEGFMNQQYLPHHQGMLFVIDPPRNVSFWMKNTHIPLDIIFIDEKNSVINVESAEVEYNVSDSNLTRYHSHLPAAYVVEINYGLSRFYGIKKGMYCIIEYE